MGSLMGDIGSMLGVSSADMVKNSTSRKGNTELNMDDFLQLMIVQLTNQTIDDTMDTSEMMNQMLQMQMITALSNMNDISVQSYANSLVGKKVTIGVINGNVLEERELFVYGTGTFNGQQVVFCEDGNMYYLNQIMAVGVLPDKDGNYTIGGGTDKPPEEEHYEYDVDGDGKDETVYVGKDGKAGTEDDWYYAGADGEGEDKTIVYAGADKTPGTEDDWYYAGVDGDSEEETFVFIGEDKTPGTKDDWYYKDVDGEKKKFFVGDDGKPGTDDDVEYKGEQGADT